MTTHYQRKRANAHSLPIDPGSLDVGYEEAEAMADELLGPPVDSHVSRAYAPSSDVKRGGDVELAMAVVARKVGGSQ
ncbi:MAG: hypothetical protein IPH07_24005 [Deltaproteobacteria bacterium]|nr:hypothetical protein [Deltaproteobacteria bacterium]MBK8241649.1 hypothetical protein [Deltaproteobacteria bacterium]